MSLAEIYEASKRVFLSEGALQTVQTLSFATLGVLSFYFVLDTVGLETGPVDPNLMLFLLFSGLAIGAAGFLYVFEIPYPFYSTLIVVTAPGIVIVREHLLHGPAGVESPVTFVFMVIIVAALVFGGGLVLAVERLR